MSWGSKLLAYCYCYYYFSLYLGVGLCPLGSMRSTRRANTKLTLASSHAFGHSSNVLGRAVPCRVVLGVMQGRVIITHLGVLGVDDLLECRCVDVEQSLFGAREQADCRSVSLKRASVQLHARGWWRFRAFASLSMRRRLRSFSVMTSERICWRSHCSS